MSTLLESALDATRRADCAMNDLALGCGDRTALRAFAVQIKAGSCVLMSFEAMGRDSVTVAHQHQALCGPGQYVRVVAA